MSGVVERLSRTIRRRGLGGSIRHVVVQAWRRVFRHQQLIYALSPEAAASLPVAAPEGVQVHRYESFEALPRGMTEAIASEQGDSFLSFIRSTLEGGAVLFVVTEDGAPASLLWAKAGARVKRWYVPLGPGDVVLFGWFTSPARRGRGLIRHAIGASVRSFMPGAQRFLADVRVWNRPSIQVMERIGFRFVTKARPLA